MLQTVAVAALATLAWWIHEPGVFASDSLTSWYEGTVGIFTSNQQPLLGVLWALFDRIGSGASLLILLSCTLFTAATYLILALYARPLIAWIGTAAILVAPQVFSQLTIINKETIAANALLLGAAVLMRRRGGVAGLVAAGVLAGFAVLVRYQYLVAIAVLFLVAAALDARRGGVRGFVASGLWLGVPFLAVAAAGTLLINATNRVTWTAIYDTNERWHLEFDLASLLAAQPGAPLDVLAAAGADTSAIRGFASSHYTPSTNIPLFPMDRLFAKVPISELKRQVDVLALSQPGRLRWHHLQTFAALLGLREVCWPIQKNIIAPLPESVEGQWGTQLGLGRLKPALATELYDWRYFPANTVLFRPILYFVLATLMSGCVLIDRRLRNTRPELLVLSASGPIYVLSFVLVAPSCDFRYSYWLVVTATIGVVAFALSLLSAGDRVPRWPT